MLKFYRTSVAAVYLFFMLHIYTGGTAMGVEAKEKLTFGFDKPRKLSSGGPLMIGDGGLVAQHVSDNHSGSRAFLRHGFA